MKTIPSLPLIPPSQLPSASFRPFLFSLPIATLTLYLPHPLPPQTRNAKGNTESATIEVCLGNLLGIFITPLLLQMFLSSSDTWAFGAPVAQGGKEGTEGLKEIYRRMGKQLGLSLFLPLVVGQGVQ